MCMLRLANLAFEEKIFYPNFVFLEKKFSFLQGKSGSGKSTLFKLINGTVSPSSGEVYYNGKKTTDWNQIQLRREIILVKQEVFLFKETIEENFLRFHKYRESQSVDRKTINRLLEICKVDFLTSKQCHELSGGEKQRVFLAIALSFFPNLFLFDEPTSALDFDTANAVMKNLKEFSNENDIACITVSHDKKLADKYADQTFVMEE